MSDANNRVRAIRTITPGDMIDSSFLRAFATPLMLRLYSIGPKTSGEHGRELGPPPAELGSHKFRFSTADHRSRMIR